MQLFAAFDLAGNIRFVGEVPRGAACGCKCPVCASPLIAKQGDKVDWHFAHEAGQERIECEAGAMNMLRRVAAEYMQAQAAPVLPPYSQRVSARSEFQTETELVQWDAQVVNDSLVWSRDGLRTHPFLKGMLSTGVPFEAHLLVSDDLPRFPPPTDTVTAKIAFWVPRPITADMVKRIYLEQHIRQKGNWVWQSHPDNAGLIQKARERLQCLANKKADSMRDKIQQMRNEFERRQREMIEARERQSAELQVQRAVRTDMPDDSTPWAPNRKPHSSFLYYRLKDGQGAWIVYTQFDGSHWLIPAPPAPDGWEEAMPPSIGRYEGGAGYRVPDFYGAIGYLAARAGEIKNTTSAHEIEQWASGL